jgi:CRISPR-associated endonuclease/helicase Cas3
LFAHSLTGRPIDEWEPLERHLREVADAAATAAAEMGVTHQHRAALRRWGQLAGAWHDVGKAAPQFQAYLNTTAAMGRDDPRRRALAGTVDHATAGALHAWEHLPPGPASIIAACIAGHHGGLPNRIGHDGRNGLEERLAMPRPETLEALRRAPADWLEPAAGSLPPPPFRFDPAIIGFQLAFLTRMLFSCLVDGDYLATERFMNPQQAEHRPVYAAEMDNLAKQLDGHLAALRDRAQALAPGSAVNRQRDVVLQRCLQAANQPPGLFDLTVPTGGGKTLSGLAFALHHAACHPQLRRVIVAIPFTSIIEQNAAVYRRALGDFGEHVLEHHSNLDPRQLDEDQHPEAVRRRLATENWDAPLVVTTNVQLFESLFAAKTSRCRKLHRVARSVIILDEAQALPPNLLAPTLAALRELVTNYGCTVVLCTATQPALQKRPGFPIGLEAPRPILPPAERDVMFASLKRVTVEQVGTLEDEPLADRLSRDDHRQALCIVNTRRHAAELFGSLRERLPPDTQDGCFHLSGQMCPRHRRLVLWALRRRLRAGAACRVVSTQLIEAGVDVDFPVVYRAVAGLDAVAQAAGRCNREGRLEGLGRLNVFEPADQKLPPFVRGPVQAAQEVLPDHPDPLTPAAQEAYFQKHYWDIGGQNGAGWDRPLGARHGEPGVMHCLVEGGGQQMQFQQAAARYRFIDDDQSAVIVPFGQRGERLVQRLLDMPDPPGRGFDRHAQAFVVAVSTRVADDLLDARVLRPLDQTHGKLVLDNRGAYDHRVGLRLDHAGREPAGLMV